MISQAQNNPAYLDNCETRQNYYCDTLDNLLLIEDTHKIHDFEKGSNR